MLPVNTAPVVFVNPPRPSLIRNLMRILFATAFLACNFLPLQGGAQAAEAVVSSGRHAIPATAQTASYSARCARTGYEIRISKQDSTVQLVIRDAAGLPGQARSFDMSDTPFGRTFLRNNLYGGFSMGCGKGVVVDFMGVELRREAQPKVVRYQIAFDDRGNVLLDRGLTEEEPDEIDVLIRH